MIRVAASLLFVVFLATACSTPRTPPVARFYEQEKANLIVRYYTDDTSYVLKPAMTEGSFLSVLKQDAVVNVAKQQPDRQLAVVILVHYTSEGQAAKVKAKWTNLLTAAGYQRVVFLHALGGIQVNGLPILAVGS
jgi:hypothetical protein